MNSIISSWFQTVLDFVFPAECAYCHQFVGDDRVLIFCRDCWITITPITSAICPRCGKPFASQTVLQYSPEFLCGACRTSPPFFDRAYSAAYYEGVLKEAIYQFKFYRKPKLGKPLARLLISRLPGNIDIRKYQAILPVPLHKSRQKERGYNQSTILARHLAQHYQLNLILDNLIRVRPTSAQSQIKGRKERQENVQNAFRISFPDTIRDRDLILIDDVLTTGATVNECSRTLKQAGAASILVLTISRASFKYRPGPSYPASGRD